MQLFVAVREFCRPLLDPLFEHRVERLNFAVRQCVSDRERALVGQRLQKIHIVRREECARFLFSDSDETYQITLEREWNQHFCPDRIKRAPDQLAVLANARIVIEVVPQEYTAPRISEFREEQMLLQHSALVRDREN